MRACNLVGRLPSTKRKVPRYLQVSKIALSSSSSSFSLTWTVLEPSDAFVRFPGILTRLGRVNGLRFRPVAEGVGSILILVSCLLEAAELCGCMDVFMAFLISSFRRRSASLSVSE